MKAIAETEDKVVIGSDFMDFRAVSVAYFLVQETVARAFESRESQVALVCIAQGSTDRRHSSTRSLFGSVTFCGEEKSPPLVLALDEVRHYCFLRVAVVLCQRSQLQTVYPDSLMTTFCHFRCEGCCVCTLARRSLPQCFQILGMPHEAQDSRRTIWRRDCLCPFFFFLQSKKFDGAAQVRNEDTILRTTHIPRVEFTCAPVCTLTLI